MIFTSKTVTVYFNDEDDQFETFELLHDSEGWELRFIFEPGWVIVYFYDLLNNKPGSTWAYPSQTVREVTSDEEDHPEEKQDDEPSGEQEPPKAAEGE